MQAGRICQFYGKNETYCDVGCSYISPHDVGLIIRYCSKHFESCMKYRELLDRFPHEGRGGLQLRLGTAG